MFEDEEEDEDDYGNMIDMLMEKMLFCLPLLQLPMPSLQPLPLLLPLLLPPLLPLLLLSNCCCYGHCSWLLPVC